MDKEIFSREETSSPIWQEDLKEYMNRIGNKFSFSAKEKSILSYPLELIFNCDETASQFLESESKSLG